MIEMEEKNIANIVSYQNQHDETHGVGVIVGDLLITAGHVVVNADKVYAHVNGESYLLDDTNRVFCESMDSDDHDASHNDIAIFRIDGLSSPLVLASELLEVGSSYTNAYFVDKSVPSEEINLPAFLKNNTETVLEQSDSLFEGLMEGNFFACKTEKVLKEGNSGCPLVKDNNVYGILHGGVPGEHKCVYQTAQSIKRIMKKLFIFFLISATFTCCKEKNNNEVSDNYMKVGDSVYVTGIGNCYHKSNCRVVKNSPTYEYTLDEAIKMGKTPCKICHRYED